jgi:RND superfamily putative drug exporter
VAGYPLPSEAARVRTVVALADLGGVERSETSVTVGELLRERLEMTQPWYRSWNTRKRTRTWLTRINSVARQSSTRPVSEVFASSTLVELPQFERAIALAAIALAEQVPVVILDQLDAFSPDDERAFVAALALIAPATTTVVIGTPIASRAIDVTSSSRTITLIDLYAARVAGTKGAHA